MRRVTLPPRQPARWGFDSGLGADRDLQPRPDLAGEARACSCSTTSSGHPARAAAAEHPVARRSRAEGRRQGADAPRVDEVAPEQRRPAPRATPGWTRFGLALENFDALGRYRDARAGRPDRPGRPARHRRSLPAPSSDLKRTLATARRRDFYRCLTEKMLTYALGRGLEAGDVDAVDAIVGRLEAGDGRASVLLLAGIVRLRRRSRSGVGCPPTTTMHDLVRRRRPAESPGRRVER